MSTFDPRWRTLSRTPANASFLDQLSPLPRRPDGSPREPYLEAGAHPDIVSHLWDELGPLLPEDCRYIAVWKPVLARPDSGRIFAVAAGTKYWLWLPEPQHAEAIAAGLVSTMTWSGGAITDLEREQGPGWLFGRFHSRDREWILAAHAGSAAGTGFRRAEVTNRPGPEARG